MYDLSVRVGVRSPHWPHIGSGVITDTVLRQVLRHEIPLLPGVTRRVCLAESSTIGHVGTHVDPPCARVQGGLTLDKFPLENCYGTGVVLDFRYMKKWQNITAEDFEKATPKVQPGDLVVVNTGWQHYWMVKDYTYYNYYPGLVPSGAEWLVKKKIKAIAGPWGALDHILAHPLKREYPWLLEEYKKETGRDAEKDYPDEEPCHEMFCQNNILAIEDAGGDLDKVTGKRCTIAAFPFRLAGSNGHPLRLVAIVDE